VIDLHSHLLPGVDDGAPNLSVSLMMARAAVAQGVTVMACTPHILPGVYHNAGPAIRKATKALQDALDQEGIALQLATGADVHMAPNFVAGLRSGQLLTLADSRYVLVEPPHNTAPPQLEEFFFNLVTAALQVWRRPIANMSPCIAGLLAYEVGQRLVTAGRRVLSVIIVDSNPFFSRSWNRWILDLPRRLTRFARLDVQKKIESLCRMFSLPQRSNSYEEFILESCRRAQRDYRPQPFNGRVILFRHSHTEAMVDQDPNGWSRLARSYTEHVVDFFDGDIVTPASVQVGYAQIAAKLREIFDLEQGRQSIEARNN
jgi:hypothetical protein